MAESSSVKSCLKSGKFSAPGFRFHPTDEELVLYYLKRKICCKKLRINVIGVFDVYKVDPSELPGLAMLKSGDRQWFYFTPRNRKYPHAARSGRGTATGYWKATGKDRVIEYNSRSVGLKKTLVFYRGRAPNGERTDWVMHEYTMDEDELGRCKNVKEYYALYKLYKKSGAGPKNGEQYGAPFQEEEWVDSDSEEADNTVAVLDDDRVEDNTVNVHLNEYEKLLNEIPSVPQVTSGQFNEFAGLPQSNSVEEKQSTLLNNSSGEFLVPQEIGEFLPNGQTYNMHSSYSFEATSSLTPHQVFEKEDYIEMNDLLNPDLGVSSAEKPAQFLNNDEYGQLNEFDQLFHDISMSLDEESVFQGTSTLSNFASNASDQRQQLIYQQFQDQTPENQLNNFIDPTATLNQLTDNMWFQNDQALLFDQPKPFSTAFASTPSGVMPESMNPTMNLNNQEQKGQNGGGGGATSQFSSALWELLESIPSTPASACEGPLNQTFVRMSSFSRIRFSGKGNGTSVTSSSKVTVAKKRIGNRGFLLLSVLGALCAMFWVFIATVGALRRPVFS